MVGKLVIKFLFIVIELLAPTLIKGKNKTYRLTGSKLFVVLWSGPPVRATITLYSIGYSVIVALTGLPI